MTGVGMRKSRAISDWKWNQVVTRSSGLYRLETSPRSNVSRVAFAQYGLVSRTTAENGPLYQQVDELNEVRSVASLLARFAGRHAGGTSGTSRIKFGNCDLYHFFMRPNALALFLRSYVPRAA